VRGPYHLPDIQEKKGKGKRDIRKAGELNSWIPGFLLSLFIYPVQFWIGYSNYSMKKTAFFLLFLIIATQSFSQEKNNPFYLGGSLGFSFNNGEYDALTGINKTNLSTSLYLSPVFGFDIRPSWLLGAGFIYDRTTSFGEIFTSSGYSSVYIKSGTYGLKFLARYQHAIREKINIALDAGMVAGKTGTSIFERDSSDFSLVIIEEFNGINFIEVYAEPEIQIYITEKFGLILSCNLITLNYSEETNLFTNNPSALSFDMSLKPENWRLGMFMRF